MPCGDRNKDSIKGGEAMKELKSSKILDIRFSEVDAMKVVWHGS